MFAGSCSMYEKVAPKRKEITLHFLMHPMRSLTKMTNFTRYAPALASKNETHFKPNSLMRPTRSMKLRIRSGHASIQMVSALEQPTLILERIFVRRCSIYVRSRPDWKRGYVCPAEGRKQIQNLNQTKTTKENRHWIVPHGTRDRLRH